MILLNFAGILAHGLQRQIFYNDRLACAQGLKPKNDYDGSCDDSYCCSKTHSQVAEWNFRVRGKCHVLRSLKEDKVLFPKVENVNFHKISLCDFRSNRK